MNLQTEKIKDVVDDVGIQRDAMNSIDSYLRIDRVELGAANRRLSCRCITFVSGHLHLRRETEQTISVLLNKAYLLFPPNLFSREILFHFFFYLIFEERVSFWLGKRETEAFIIIIIR